MNIPNDVVSNVNENNTQRVILLVMSTLPDKQKASIETYQYQKDDRYVFKGISQLEAGTKYYLQKLATSKTRIDRIVVVASPETTDKENNEYGVSAVDLYKSRIAEYITNGTSQSTYDLNDKYLDAAEKQFEGCDLYKGYSDKDFFKIINSSSTNDDTANKKNVKTLLETRDAIIGDSERIELFFDMQGGFRNDIPLFNTVLELLSDMSVSVVERVATDYNWKNDIQPMKTVNDLYESYDLVTAYQIFKKYGWGKQLSEYFDENNTAENEITKAIVEISESIKVCNVEGFDHGLNDLHDAINIWKESDHSDSQMNFIINEIEKDFTPLISSGPENYKYIEQIKWCLKKDFIQQAITIFESKIPTEFVHSGIYYYCKDSDNNRQAVMNSFIQIYDNYKNNGKSYDTYKLADINHYWVRYYKNDVNKGTVTIREHYGNNDQEKAKELIRKYLGICKKRNSINHAITTKHNTSGFFETIRSMHPEDRAYGQISQLDVNDIIKFIEEFEKAADEISESVRGSVVDLS